MLRPVMSLSLVVLCSMVSQSVSRRADTHIVQDLVFTEKQLDAAQLHGEVDANLHGEQDSLATGKQLGAAATFVTGVKTFADVEESSAMSTPTQVHGQVALLEQNKSDDPTAGEGGCPTGSYARGVGTIPPLRPCPSGLEQDGALCYPPCPSDTPHKIGLDCYAQGCPEGFRDDGLYCRNAEYGRGFGYAFWDKDKCWKDHPQGCEWHLAMVYPKCKEGYSPFGCCICRPESFQCSDYDLGDQLDLSCQKKKFWRSLEPQAMVQDCTLNSKLNSENTEMNAGLCYKPCAHLYQGFGPVCVCSKHEIAHLRNAEAKESHDA